jgi:hypothetical protein
VPGLYRCGFLIPPDENAGLTGTVFFADFVWSLDLLGKAICFLGFFTPPPVDLRAVVLVLAIF